MTPTVLPKVALGSKRAAAAAARGGGGKNRDSVISVESSTELLGYSCFSLIAKI